MRRRITAHCKIDFYDRTISLLRGYAQMSMMPSSIDDLDGRECHGSAGSGIQKRIASYSKSVNIIFIHAIHVGERPRFDFHLWKSNEITRDADFREENLTNNKFWVISSKFGPWRWIEIKSESQISFRFGHWLLKIPKGYRIFVVVPPHIEIRNHFWKQWRCCHLTCWIGNDQM